MLLREAEDTTCVYYEYEDSEVLRSRVKHRFRAKDHGMTLPLWRTGQVLTRHCRERHRCSFQKMAKSLATDG
jgi:hypothetical protein